MFECKACIEKSKTEDKGRPLVWWYDIECQGASGITTVSRVHHLWATNI